MLIYGDPSRLESPRTLLDELIARVQGRGDSDEPWIVRHARLVNLFLRAGELAQGLDDADFALAGRDELTPWRRHRAQALRDLAAAVLCSFVNRRLATPEALLRALRRLGATAGGGEITTKLAEGYAFYAVYPEAYGQASSPLRSLDVTVLGLRSIGVTLGAIVAASTGAEAFVTLRPSGPPFDRRILLGSDLETLLRARRCGAFAIVDEGPGLSGSSMVGCADALEALGAPASSIVFLPSHTGLPGWAASETARARWMTTRRHVATFDDLAGGQAAPSLAEWVEDLTGPPHMPLDDISGGRWRDLLPYPRRPPGGGMREKRKFLLTSGRGVFLLRFVGLGDSGEEALRRARTLSEAGLVPAVLGLRHGFLVERWMSDARPLDPENADRSALLVRLAEYLVFRAQRLPAAPSEGANLQLLAMMTVRNGELALGRPMRAADLDSNARRLEPRVRRVNTDNRLHAWEWLRLPDNRLLKTDAFDHCASHDLVGSQDIAWDVVGAEVELQLSKNEICDLRTMMATAGIDVDDELLAFYRPCYAAFQLGSFYLDASSAVQYPSALTSDFQLQRYVRILVESSSVHSRPEPSM